MPKAYTLWFTGMSGAGKSTLSARVVEELRRRGEKVELLDGDEVRTHLSKGLGFSKEDRDINIDRIGYVCHLLTRNGVWAVSAAISPYREARDKNRKLIGNFVEIYVECSLEKLAERDVKGLYKKAKAGEIGQFTGLSDPYEPPANPEVTVNSEKETPDESFRKIIRFLEDRNYLSRPDVPIKR
ncbi:MAG: adenylyl-sulfate kinase [Elusimicrobia bacterium]|nr:adenylyl-sulfate kinase [Elusimicrobiota bacterium]